MSQRPPPRATLPRLRSGRPGQRASPQVHGHRRKHSVCQLQQMYHLKNTEPSCILKCVFSFCGSKGLTFSSRDYRNEFSDCYSIMCVIVHLNTVWRQFLLKTGSEGLGFSVTR